MAKVRAAQSQMIGGDPVQNIDRVLRLPGTWNLPADLKAKKGGVKQLATAVVRTGRFWSLEAIEQHLPVEEDKAGTDKGAGGGDEDG